MPMATSAVAFYRITRTGRRTLKTEAERLAGLVDLIRARRLLGNS